tara:strand:- start:903 stop:1682 length:780 start_codon:yes stop_codon:yes gene_type:complete
MRKILLLLFFIICSNAYADKIDVIKHSRAGGLIDRMNEVIALSLGDNFGQFIKAENCVQAKKIISNHKGKVLTAWPTEREAHGSPCNLDNNYLLSTFSNSPYHLTYFEGNDEAADINFLKKGETVIVGVWDSSFWAPPQTEFLQSINPNIKVVRYKSKPFRTALASGEIDYKLVSFPGNDPVIAIMNGESILPEHKFSDMGYSMMFVGNFSYSVRSVYESTAWQERKDKTHMPWLEGQFKEYKIKFVEDMLTDISETNN